ncbi:MAG: phosphotransferase [Chloroflexi bacterium]|nr:phosphotransferase [Chloroflexota bacterium]
MLQRVGEFMGKLHNQAANFKPPFRFKRQSWDLKGLTKENLDIPESKARAALTSQQLAVIDSSKEKVMSVMQRLGGGPDVFGLIHADLHQRNYLFHRGEVRAIDFDTCGWGYYLYDLAVTLTTLLDHAEFSEMKAALLSGYNQVRELPQDHENLLTIFAAARLMTHTLLLAGHKDDPFFRDTAANIIHRQIKMIARLISLD